MIDHLLSTKQVPLVPPQKSSSKCRILFLNLAYLHLLDILGNPVWPLLGLRYAWASVLPPGGDVHIGMSKDLDCFCVLMTWYSSYFNSMNLTPELAP